MIAAITGIAVVTTLFPTGRNSAALAQAETDLIAAPAPVAVAEMVPQAIEYVSAPLIQHLPDDIIPSPAPTDTLTEAGSLAELVRMLDTDAPMDEQLRCLAGAVYFEARGEPLAGQLAVAQVIINRTEDGRFPRTYCAVVAQPGQFSFMRGRKMPAVRTGSPAWERAVAIAQIAHRGLWESQAEDAVYFHARYVHPGWSQTKTRLAQIDTHIFYR